MDNKLLKLSRYAFHNFTAFEITLQRWAVRIEGVDAVVVLNEHDASILNPIGLLCVPWTHMHAYIEFLIKGNGGGGVDKINL